jgi:hypothetical protein
MMKKILLCIFIIFVFALISQQPAPYIQESLSVHPIVENEELGSKYWYIRSIKVYYKDPMKEPIYLSKNYSLYSYCSDSSVITFKSLTDSISIPSIKRMSCQILAIINLTRRDSEWLKSHIVYEFIVLNTVTDNRYVIYMHDTEYFRKLLTKYNANY